jgi:hypothetical protein
MKATQQCSLVVLLAVLCISLNAQVSNAQKSPKEVVEALWKLDTEGLRLTDDGWRKASPQIFVQAVAPPQPRIIYVIDGYEVDREMIHGDTASVEVSVLDYWSIDSRLNLHLASTTMKSWLAYKLVFTDTHSEIGPDGMSKEVKGPQEWRIPGTGSTIWLSSQTAINYVKQLRDKTTNPQIKVNAQKTIATLERRQHGH